MAQRSKFKPNETALENYQAGAVNWSMVRFKFATPIGPDQKQYDPYYLYSVVAEVGGQTLDCAWFVNVDEHNIIQKAGATKDSLMGTTYVMEGKRRGLVVAHSGGPIAQRDPATVEAETEQALFQLAGGEEAANLGADTGLGEYSGGMLGPPAPVHPPPPQQGMPPQQAVPQPPQPPAPVPTPPPPVPGTTYTGPSATPPVPPQPPAPSPPQTPAPKPAPAPQPPAPPAEYNETYNGANKVYMAPPEAEVDVWKAYWRDLAKLHIWAYHEFASVTKELDLPKIKPTDQREMVTSITIETWRQMGKGRSPLPGWIVVETPVPPPDMTTKNGALEAINALVPGEEEAAGYFIKRWLDCVIQPVESLESWKHAANIAKLFGLDAEVLFAEHDADHLMVLTQAIWTYADARDEGLDQNDSLSLVAEEYGLPVELMDFLPVEDEVEEGEEDDEPPF